jgi:hypothetical protein
MQDMDKRQLMVIVALLLIAFGVAVLATYASLVLYPAKP